MNRAILASAILALSVAGAFAQSAQAGESYDQAVRNGDVTSGGADRGPGGLSAHDVVGKRLLDSNGDPIGMIRRVSADGQTAMVTPNGGGKSISVDMDRLSLGMGVHTVIEETRAYPRTQAPVP